MWPLRVPSACPGQRPACLVQGADLPVQEVERESARVHVCWNQTLPGSFLTSPGALTSNPIRCDLRLNKSVFSGLSLLRPGAAEHPPPPSIAHNSVLRLLQPTPTLSCPSAFPGPESSRILQNQTSARLPKCSRFTRGPQFWVGLPSRSNRQWVLRISHASEPRSCCLSWSRHYLRYRRFLNE